MGVKKDRATDRQTDTIVVTLSSAKVPLRKLEEDEREKEKEKKLGTKGGVEPVIKRRTPETKRQKQVRQGKAPGEKIKKKKSRSRKSQETSEAG